MRQMKKLCTGRAFLDEEKDANKKTAASAAAGAGGGTRTHTGLPNGFWIRHVCHSITPAMEYPLSISELGQEVKKKSCAKARDLWKKIDIAVPCGAAGMFHTLITVHFALSAGRCDFKTDDLAGKQKDKKDRTNDQRQLKRLLFEGLKNKNMGHYNTGSRIWKEMFYYKYVKH